MSGKNLAIIAPTSFGKSFIIDAFIALKQPKNTAIIVPTIALTDETRRRLQTV
jgi:reverse gyrase